MAGLPRPRRPFAEGPGSPPFPRWREAIRPGGGAVRWSAAPRSLQVWRTASPSDRSPLACRGFPHGLTGRVRAFSRAFLAAFEWGNPVDTLSALTNILLVVTMYRIGRVRPSKTRWLTWCVTGAAALNLLYWIPVDDLAVGFLGLGGVLRLYRVGSVAARPRVGLGRGATGSGIGR